MRILYLHQYFVFPENNGGTRSYDLAKSFVAKGFNVEVITSTAFISNYSFSQKWNIIERDGIRIHALKLKYSNKLSYIKRIIVFIQFLWYSTIKLFHLKGDLLLVTSTPLTIGIPALLKKWIQKTPFIFEVRDVWPESVIAIGAIKNKLIKKTLYYLEQIIYKNASAIIPLSTDMKQSIVSRYPFLNNKPIQTIENISVINRFQKKHTDKGSILETKIGFKPRFTILYAGTFGKVNDLHYVVKLAKKLINIDSSIVFVLIGDGGEKESIKELARAECVLNKNIFILEPVGKNKLPQLYFDADMGSSFVSPIEELWANSANKFFDTLAAGKPILINYEGWQKGVIGEDNIGFVLPSNLDGQSIINFVEYTKDVNLQQLQRHNAIKKARNSYSLSIAVDKYLSIINGVV